MRRKITKRNDTMDANDEGEEVVSPEGEDENSPTQSPGPAPTQRMGISNIKRSLTLKKKIVIREKPIKWTDRIALRQSRAFQLEKAHAHSSANQDEGEKK